MTKQFDMAVVGAGPAGAAAAIYAAMQGLKVVLCESYHTPKHRPGESLPPGIEIIFKQLGVWSTISEYPFIRNRGHYTLDEESNQSQFHAYGADLDGQWKGLQIPRIMLDTILKERAMALGVNVLSGCHIKKIILNDNPSLLSQDNQIITAKYYVDATGASHLLARHLNSPMQSYSPTLIAEYGYLNNNCPYQTLPIFIETKSGWMWYAEVEPQLYAWVRVKKSTQVAAVNKIHKSHGANVTWRIAQRLAGFNFFVVGDAACVLDPSAGHGVLRALMTGMKAADHVEKILSKKQSETDAYVHYSQWLAHWFQCDMDELNKRLLNRRSEYASSNL